MVKRILALSLLITVVVMANVSCQTRGEPAYLSSSSEETTNECAWSDVSNADARVTTFAFPEYSGFNYNNHCIGDYCNSSGGSCVGKHCYVNASSKGWCVGDSCYVNGSGCCAGASCYVNGSGYCQGAGCNVNGTMLPIRCCGDGFVLAVQISLRNTTADSSVMNTTK